MSPSADDRRREMKKVAFLAISLVIGLIIFSSRVSFTGEGGYEYVDDATITTKVNAIIAEDPDAPSLKINADTTGGNVVLIGSVNSKVTKERLISKIKLIKGVKSVRSLLKVKD
jgi:osmotically-inducible protein OsmY